MLNRSLLFAAAVLFAATAIDHAPAVWRGRRKCLRLSTTRLGIGSRPLRTNTAAHAAIRLTVSPSRLMAEYGRDRR